MLDEHLACPQCGYDLHGIPESRCPECGFGYDAAALQSMANTAGIVRLEVARRVIVRATIAGGLALPSVCDRLGVSGWFQFWVLAVAYIVAFSTWLILTDAYRGLISVPNLLTLFVAHAVAIYYLLGAFHFLAVTAGVIVLAMAWHLRLRDWPALSTPANVESEELRCSVAQYSRTCLIALIAATALVLIALVG